MQNRCIAPPPELEFFNGLGGFDRDGRDYVIVLDGAATTPAPWINVIANAGFGFQASATGSGYTWAENSRENQLTPWSNDPVTDPPGEAFFVRDSETGQLWSPTAQPIRDGGRYVARHGFGTCRFEHEAHGIALDLLQYVPLDDPVKISRLTLTNRSARPRRLSVTAYADWVLGPSRAASAPHVITEIDTDTGALHGAQPLEHGLSGPGRLRRPRGEQTSLTGDRTAFLGQGGGLHAPAGLLSGQPLSGATGAGYDPCAVLSRDVALAPGQSVEVVFLLGQGGSAEAARGLIERYRAADLDAVLGQVTDHWAEVLGAVQVTTPDRAMDIMLNGWLLYQTLACRIRARAAFYQASGAYGFRDQLQDGMALSFALPEETRAQILRAASRQFVEGDVQHWWLPHSGQGVRSRISDDRVWLAFAAATYVGATGDGAVLDEPVPFLDGPALEPGAHDAFFQPMPAELSASLFEHCARGLDQCLELTGPQGLPLMGTGDWNDGMNRVGEAGRGESVWLGWLLLRTLALFAPLAAERDPERAQRWQDHAAKLRRAMERHAWDGDWYRRATYDDGTWLGSAEAAECRIDSIAQSWAVLSGAADPARAALAMAALDRELIRRDDRLALLFTPPFDQAPGDPGYIKGYPPGLRENGGQYSHAAMWAILAFAELGEGDRAAELFALLNPINHARTPAEVARYKVEPYVVAADVYSVAPHVGRGGWTWYTGSAAWMYRAGIEGILGLRREGDVLVVRPRLPADWPGFQASVTLGAARLDIRVEGRCASATLDGAGLECRDGQVRIRLEPGRHALWIGATPDALRGVAPVPRVTVGDVLTQARTRLPVMATAFDARFLTGTPVPRYVRSRNGEPAASNRMVATPIYCMYHCCGTKPSFRRAVPELDPIRDLQLEAVATSAASTVIDTCVSQTSGARSADAAPPDASSGRTDMTLRPRPPPSFLNPSNWRVSTRHCRPANTRSRSCFRIWRTGSSRRAGHSVQVRLQPRASHPGLSRTLTVPLAELDLAAAKDKLSGRALTDFFLEEKLADPMIRLFMQADGSPKPRSAASIRGGSTGVTGGDRSGPRRWPHSGTHGS